MSQMTVFNGPERRRHWSDEDRARILGEAFAPGACVAAVARRYDISTGLLYTWRGKHRCEASGPEFAAAVVTGEPHRDDRGFGTVVAIDLPSGVRVNISASAPPALATMVLRALR